MRPGEEVSALDRLLTFAHWAWFFEPHLSLIYILVRDEPRFVRAARQMAARLRPRLRRSTSPLPTAPPWWAAENGYTGDERVHRRMLEVGEEVWGRAWPTLYDSRRRQPVGGDALAALRRLGARRDPAQRVGPAGRRRRLDLRRRARPRARLSRRALRRRPDRRARAGRGVGAHRCEPLARAALRLAISRGVQALEGSPRAEAGRAIAEAGKASSRPASVRRWRLTMPSRWRAIAKIGAPRERGDRGWTPLIEGDGRRRGAVVLPGPAALIQTGLVVARARRGDLRAAAEHRGLRRRDREARRGHLVLVRGRRRLQRR